MTRTPLSDDALQYDWPQYVAEMRSRLEAGRREYGDASFHRDPDELVREIQQELLDTSNWAFLLWHRLERIRLRIQDIK